MCSRSLRKYRRAPRLAGDEASLADDGAARDHAGQSPPLPAPRATHAAAAATGHEAAKLLVDFGGGDEVSGGGRAN